MGDRGSPESACVKLPGELFPLRLRNDSIYSPERLCEKVIKVGGENQVYSSLGQKFCQNLVVGIRHAVAISPSQKVGNHARLAVCHRIVDKLKQPFEWDFPVDQCAGEIR